MKAAARKPLWRRMSWRLLQVAIVFAVLSLTVVLALRWLPPPTTAFVIARHVDGWTGAAANVPVRRVWVAQSRIAPEMFLAVVAAEDQRFPDHHGFDLQAIEQALDDREKGKVRGASTISQQVAKNLFLWSGRSWVRKGLEVWFTGLIELCWPKRRILEMYVNIAEFGDGVYGAQAASKRYFGRDAVQLNSSQAARLAAVLPNPKHYSVARPGPYVLRRQQWIERQMRQLGGRDYLAPLLSD
ncbi:MAG TPA: monofunctional biosynthetic peptidoglycan transglycosylase [Patescibacteria group bacterium]|nr:monofunctional biosynthetic peptidoglycan transglycosylase [Patescibacteria group bacterium]